MSNGTRQKCQYYVIYVELRLYLLNIYVISKSQQRCALIRISNPYLRTSLSQQVTHQNIKRSICKFHISAGFGLYHHLLLGIFSACAFSRATAFMIIPFGLPLAMCDLEFSEDMLICIDLSLYLGEKIYKKYRQSLFIPYC